LLVLSRKESESIRIGPVRLVVVQTLNDRVRLGFDGPRSVAIVRSELEDEVPFSPKQYTKDFLELLAVQLGLANAEEKLDQVADRVLSMMESK
jgi:carbon storage regulator CsrA